MSTETSTRRNAAVWSRTAAFQPNLLTILALLAAFAATWALFFTVTEAPVAIKHDMSEAYAWGHEFQLGYNQHPPFWAWICGLWFSVFPRTGWAFALLSSLNAGIGLWGAWLLLGHFAGGEKRVAAWALLLLTPLYTFYAYKYNANIIFLSIWPWTLHYFMSSVQSRRTGDAIAFGVCVGFAMMSKYYALILVATCFLAALQLPSRWKYLGSRSPYISAVVVAAICAPHVWWLLTHQAPPLRYLAATANRDWPHVFGHIGDTLLGALAMNLGVLAVVGLLAWMSRRGARVEHVRDPHGVPRRVLVTLALAPLVLTVASALVLRNTITPEMTVGIFPLLPLLVMEFIGAVDFGRLARVSIGLGLTVMFGAALLSPVVAWVRTYLSPNAMNIAPYQEIAVEATRLWHDRTSSPLSYVAGSDWYDNAITFYSTDRPSTFVRFNYSVNLWVTPERLARHGLLSVCRSDDAFCLDSTAKLATPETIRMELSVAHAFWGHSTRPVRFVVTIIPPRG
jgi:4-amino-4-deoxy-L-arabinose transferase-like glycosyltransferase